MDNNKELKGNENEWHRKNYNCTGILHLPDDIDHQEVLDTMSDSTGNIELRGEIEFGYGCISGCVIL